MRKLAIATALATTMLATPAVARDRSGYVGLEGGVMIVEDTGADFDDDEIDINDAFNIDHNTGYDIDVIGGFDFGMVRVEGELAHKRAGVDALSAAVALSGEETAGPFDAGGHVSIMSGMVNALLDFGDDDGWSAYIGPGIGYAKVKYKVDLDDLDIDDAVGFSESSSGLAWQVVAGVRHPITANMDLGLKYRFFQANNLDFGDGDESIDAKVRSHSLLLSLIFNFAAPVPPPPPPPPPPPEPVRG